MKDCIEFNLDEIFRKRREKVFDFMKANKIDAVLFEDSETKRDVAIRYFTGHSSDSLLIFTQSKSFLLPWDLNLAEKNARIENIIPYTDFKRESLFALKEILSKENLLNGSTVELPQSFSHLDFLKFSEEASTVNFQCRKDGVHNFAVECRAVKDQYEISCTKKACAITDLMTDEIEQMLKTKTELTEMDIALYIEKFLRLHDCERTSFDTLAAGPERSFAIHAFPGYTSSLWGTEGLSILDYGVCYKGYASDCTLTIAKGPLNKEQEKLLDLVETAGRECLKLYKPSCSILKAAQKADEIFAAEGKKMPHSLGHGTGLEIHEAPFVTIRADENKVFKSGNIVTLEPGLYDPDLGGTRLENDVLITDDSNLVLTKSRIIRL